MSRPTSIFSKRTRLFSPAVTRHLRERDSAVVGVTSANLSGSFLDLSSSFRYDPIGAPLRSTQQIPVDWSDFSRHTFFNSAESKVNIAFDKMINGYPFDGTKEEHIQFVDGLTGFEKYVLDLFPKNVGFINLGGVREDGSLRSTYLEVKDIAGSHEPDISRNKTGNSVLDSKNNSITFEFFVNPAPAAEYEVSDQVITTPCDNRALIQRLSSDKRNGIGIYLLSGTNDSSNETLQMIVSSGTIHISASFSLEKDKWTHVSCQFNKTPGINKLHLYRDGELVATSSTAEIGYFDFQDQNILIGAGETHLFSGSFGQPSNLSLDINQIFSGSIDELRIFHVARSSSTIKDEMFKNIFSRNSLKLYYKFNEPHGEYSGANLVLDSSGNSIHSSIINYDENVRNKFNISLPLLNEELIYNPILFPRNENLINLNVGLLETASVYDTNNPNLITKLIPQHYLEEASIFEGLNAETRLGNAGDPYGYNKNMPGGGKFGSPQIVATLLLMWAKYFDEIKMYLDQFGKLLNVDVIEEGSIADNFLPFVAEYYGLTLPRIVDNASIGQLIENESLTSDVRNSKKPIKKIQYIIWRRILSDIRELVNSKGTMHSIKSLMRNIGINPDNNFRFKEFGGAKTRRISDSRQVKSAVYGMIDMSSTYLSTGAMNAQGVLEDSPFLTSSFLSTFRNEENEPGFPNIDVLADDLQNGLFTSGSWSFEAIYKFPEPLKNEPLHNITQSLVRLCATGSQPAHLIFANLIAFSGSNDLGLTGSLSLFLRPQPNLSPLTIPMTGVDIFDGNKWHITFGRQRNDEINNTLASSYFLRAARTSGGKIVEYFSTSSLFNDHDPSQINVFEKIDADYNSSGLFVAIGQQRLESSDDSSYGTTAGLGSINDSDVGNELNCSTIFGGRIARIRFWSKSLSELETREHAMNVGSLGVKDPKINFNFNVNDPGTFERLRIDTNVDQAVTESNTLGNIQIFDYSQNLFHLEGSGFLPNGRVIKPENFEYSILSPHFESSNSNNKVRVRSFVDPKNVQNFNASIAPLFSIPANETPKDDTRFSIEISLVQALNEDIINIFATLDTFDDIIGDPTAQFSDDYRDLTFIADIYFKRLNKKINVSRYFDFFKWFDTTIGDTIENLLPRKTKFLGSNYVIEPHILERAKFRYNNFDIYIGPNDRYGLKGQILLQQFIAEILRY